MGMLHDNKPAFQNSGEGNKEIERLSANEQKCCSESVKQDEPVLSKRKRKRLAKHQQWLERKEQKK